MLRKKRSKPTVAPLRDEGNRDGADFMHCMALISLGRLHLRGVPQEWTWSF